MILVGEAQHRLPEVRSALSADVTILLAPSLDALEGLVQERLAGRDRRPPPPPLRAGDLTIDVLRRETRRGATPLNLTEHELEILAIMASEPVRAWSFGELIETVWGRKYGADRAVLRSAVKRLRTKLSAAGTEVRIEAARGMGYRLTGMGGELDASDRPAAGYPEVRQVWPHPRTARLTDEPARSKLHPASG